MRRTRRDYKKEVTREPFELELENPVEGGPEFVTFRDPNKLDSESAFDMDLMRPKEVVELLLSKEDHQAWWREWRSAPIEETNDLLKEVHKHYGADPGKLPR